MRTQTRSNGEKTSSHVRHSNLTIQNKNPDFDYCFRRRKDIEDGGGQDIYGWEPIKEGNESGEVFAAFPGQKRTGGSKQMLYMDTIACRRPKSVTRYFKAEEDEKYNAQIRHVKSASKRARDAFREMDPDSVVQEKASFKGPGMSQRVGPTQEGE